jgi:hypothetical protein
MYICRKGKRVVGTFAGMEQPLICIGTKSHETICYLVVLTKTRLKNGRFSPTSCIYIVIAVFTIELIQCPSSPAVDIYMLLIPVRILFACGDSEGRSY